LIHKPDYYHLKHKKHKEMREPHKNLGLGLAIVRDASQSSGRQTMLAKSHADALHSGVKPPRSIKNAPNHPRE
jgi:hypothetical protein